MNTYLAIKEVQPVAGFKLILTFSNKEKRLFDVKPFLNKGIFKELKDVDLFNTVHVSFDTIEWDNEADFDPEVLYKLSKKIDPKKYSQLSASNIAAEPNAKYKKKSRSV